MLLGPEAEGVHVDAGGVRDVCVVLVGLDKIKVLAVAGLESVVAVKLELCCVDGVHGVFATKGVFLDDGDVEELVVDNSARLGGVVGPLVESLGNLVELDSPDKLLDGVIEVEARFVRRVGDGLLAGVLQLLDEVLVLDLCESSALLGVEVHVVDPERGVGQAEGSRVGIRDIKVGEVVELDVDLDLVVLERDERQGKAGVSAEPELQGHVDPGLRLGSALDTQRLGQLPDHLFVSGFLPDRCRQLAPHFEPVAVVLVDALASDLNLDVIHDKVSDRVDPSEAGGVGVVDVDCGQRRLEIDSIDEVSVSRYCTGDPAPKVRVPVECLLDRLHSKIGVASVDDLKVCNLRVSSQINILSAISYELH